MLMDQKVFDWTELKRYGKKAISISNMYVWLKVYIFRKVTRKVMLYKLHNWCTLEILIIIVSLNETYSPNFTAFKQQIKFSLEIAFPKADTRLNYRRHKIKLQIKDTKLEECILFP